METKNRPVRRTETFGVDHLTVVPENFEPNASSDGADEAGRRADPDDT